MFGKKVMNGEDKGGDGKEFGPVCGKCSGQGSYYDGSLEEGSRMVICDACDTNRASLKNPNPDIQPKVPEPEVTQGEYLVGIDFNPGGDEAVTLVKVETAKLLDNLGSRMAECMQPGGNDGAGRCYAIAMSKYEEACMWAVKGLTKPLLGE